MELDLRSKKLDKKVSFIYYFSSNLNTNICRTIVMSSLLKRPPKTGKREDWLRFFIAFGASGQMPRLVKTGRLSIARNSMSKVSRDAVLKLLNSSLRLREIDSTKEESKKK
jgi:hypothetical protein